MSRSRVDNREYMREYRARKRVDEKPPVEDEPCTVVQDRVRTELDSLPQSTLMAATAAVAMAMARVLDNPDAVPQHPAAAGQLRMAMTEIRNTDAPAAKEEDTLSKLRRTKGRVA